MAKKSLKARGMTGGGGSDFDFKKLHDQVDEGTQGARISVIVDLGFHLEGMALGGKGHTGFLTEEDAEQWAKEMEVKYKGSQVFKDGSLEVEDADDVDFKDTIKTLFLDEDGSWVESDEAPEYIVSANEYGGTKKYQELAMFADLTENIVDYGGTIGEKPFRIMLNRRWNKQVQGFVLKPTKPEKDGQPWTIKGNTKLAELAKATGHKELLECELRDADWTEMAGEAFNITIEKAGDDDQFVNVGKCVTLKKRKGELEEVAELENDCIVLLMDDVTVEELEAAFLRKEIVDKIKQATDYQGSAMQKAIVELEKRKKAKAEEDKEDDDNQDDDDDDASDDEPEEKVERKVTKVDKTKGAAKTKPKPKAEPEEEPSGQDNDDDWDE